MANIRSTTPPPRNEPVLGYAPGSPERSTLITELKRQAGTRVEIPLVIGEKKILNAKAEHKVVSPHKHAHQLATYTAATAEDVTAAIQSNLAARKEWAALNWEDRAAVFLKAAELLAGKYRPVMNAATMLGQSKTSHQAEIDAACELIDFFRFNVHFAERIYSEQPQSAPGMWNRSETRGLEGFVYAVCPFNFTSIAINLPTAPALMGCSVLWKPAPTSLLSAYVGMQVLEEAGLPPGVINLVVGDPALISSVALAHPDLSGIHFTGSTGVFNTLWKTVGQNIDRYKTYPRLVGETGGKDFVFAHPSANVQELVTGLIRGAFEFQGQKCSAASRAYIPKSLWPAVKDGLVATAEQIKVGDTADFSNFMGAVIDQRAFNKIKGYIDDAKQSKDARIVFGGDCDDKVGYFIQPTIIEALDPHYRSMREEIFGPVLTLYVYDDAKLDETLALCDTSSPYALTGAIYARDRRVIAHMTRALEHSAGNFYINDKPTGAVVGQQPFGGGRASGTNDKAGSIWNLLRWCSHRTIKETFHPITDFRYAYMENGDSK
jgi:1-pyrroline-5-carboxylate dehydrogenase